ncbi:nek kinase [Cystoisospora suis]|uniref:non-specific serine/threonine protein kinase n=1 Tax=Cystoisospora suis TaxID=483139 RepID=A0A2C6KZR9_9APIC|nr:nek kinase [Cystoisospora suis]
MDRYKRVKRLGAGAQGFCYLVRDKKTGKLFVTKEIKLGLLTPEQRQDALKEATILQDVSAHPNVIAYVSSHLEPKKQTLHMLIEYADGGDLDQQIQLRRNLLDEQLEAHLKQDAEPVGTQPIDLKPYTPLFFKEEHVLLVFVQAVAGLHHLHSGDILHRDIKSQNIFLSSDGLIKLGDFGIARQLNKDKVAKTYVGSPCYMSPELYKRDPYNYKSDIWALGCVLYELCCLRKPFQGPNIVVLAMQITQNPPPSHLDSPPDLYPPALHQLASRMLQVDPAARPDTREILAMPYIVKSIKKLIKRALNTWMCCTALLIPFSTGMNLFSSYPQLGYLRSYVTDSQSLARELAPSDGPFDEPFVSSEGAHEAKAILQHADSDLNPLTAPSVEALFAGGLTDHAPEAHAVVSILRRKHAARCASNSSERFDDAVCACVRGDSSRSRLWLQDQLLLLWEGLRGTMANSSGKCSPASATGSPELLGQMPSEGTDRAQPPLEHNFSPEGRRSSHAVTFADGSSPHGLPSAGDLIDISPATIPWGKLPCTPDQTADSGCSSFEETSANWCPEPTAANAVLLKNPFCSKPLAGSPNARQTPSSSRDHHQLTKELFRSLKALRKKAKHRRTQGKTNLKVKPPTGQLAAELQGDGDRGGTNSSEHPLASPPVPGRDQDVGPKLEPACLLAPSGSSPPDSAKKDIYSALAGGEQGPHVGGDVPSRPSASDARGQVSSGEILEEILEELLIDG